jgi:hypothetical protein
MMLKPPAANMPGMTDTLDFVKNLWGSMNLPGANLSGMSAPPMSAEDLDKRITDLKAVESWLNMNITMLRGTIQTMEVQRATMASLKAMGASMAEAMRQSGVSAEKMAATPFGPFFGQPGGATPASPAAGANNASGGGSAQPGAPAADQASAPSSAQGGTPDPAAMGMPAAMAWWNMLQEQFTQAVATAMTPADGAAKAAPQAEAAAPTQAPEAEPAPEAGAQPNGNGRARGGKPKADKA